MCLFRVCTFLVLTSGLIPAQTAPILFEVASIKPSASNDLPFRSNFPLGPGSGYVPNGGIFSAANYPLATYAAFAYEVVGVDQEALLSQLPRWATTEKFDIEARADPSKDTKAQMRLMMRSLLADRFKLVLHFETRQGSIWGLTAVNPGKTGPLLRPHSGDSCTPQTQTGDFPAACGALAQMPSRTPGSVRFGARNVTIKFIADMLVSMGALDRPLSDQTGLAGTFDFALEFVYLTPGAKTPVNLPGTLFEDAVREQLGLKLDSQKGPIEVLVLDHVERPSEN